MKVSQLRQLIKEEIRGVLNESLSYDELIKPLENSDKIILGDENDPLEDRVSTLFLELTNYAYDEEEPDAKAVIDQINNYLIENGKIVIDGVDCTEDYWDFVYDLIESNKDEEYADEAIKILKPLVMSPGEAKNILKQYPCTQSKLEKILNNAGLTYELDEYIMEKFKKIEAEIEKEKAQKQDNNMGQLGASLSEIKRRHSR